MEIIKRYWPTLIGALLVGFLGSRLISAPDEAEPTPEADGFRHGPPVNTEPEEPTSPQKRPAPTQDETSIPAEAEYEYREKLIAFEQESAPQARSFNADSPEVKKALNQVQIEVYAPGNGSAPYIHERFFKHNHLKFSVHDTTDSMEHERARRLGEKYEEVLITIDGQTLDDPSEQELQTAIQAAVKKRVENSLREEP